MATATFPAGLIDSDILVDALRGWTDAISFLTAQKPVGGLVASVIVVMELIQGCGNSADLAQVNRILQPFVIVQVEDPTSRRAHQRMQSFFLSHGLLIADALIAATALEVNRTLYTKNLRHFQMIPGLTVVRPY